MKKIFIGFFFSIISSTCFAQTANKTVHSREQLWAAYFNQTRLTDKFGFWADVQYRRTDNFVDRPFQLLIRPAVTYFFNNNIRFNAGYLYVHHYPSSGMQTSRPEHRPWQQIWWGQSHNGFSTIQYLRLEQRFLRLAENDKLLDEYRFTNRVRYSFTLMVPLTGKEISPRTPFLVLSDELFINFGKNIVYNFYDQNRFFLGLGYQLNPTMNVQMGYFNIYQQESVGNVFQNNHAIRLAMFHNLDLRK